MKFLNKIKRVIAPISFIVLATFGFSGFSQADQVEEMFKIQSCSDLKAGFQVIAKKANDANADTKDIKFNYIDALNCNTAILDQNIFTKVNYIIFGDAAIYANELAATIVKSTFGFDDIKNINFADRFKTAMDAQGVKPIIATVSMAASVSDIMMTFSVAILIVFMIFYIANTASDGESLGRGTSAGWIIARVGITLGLILPMDNLGGFAPIQILILSIAILGNLLANVIAFMMPIFEFLDKTDVEKVEFDNSTIAYSSISDIIDTSVGSHICDIQMRKKIILFDKTQKTLDSANIKNDPFYQCINDKYDAGVFAGSNSAIKSDVLVITEFCAKETKDLNVSCSNNSIADISSINSQNSPVPKIRENLLKNDELFRNIASKVIVLSCVDIEKTSGVRSAEYLKSCSDFNGNEFRYDNLGDTDKVSVYPELSGDTLDVMTENFTNAVLIETQNLKTQLYKEYVTLLKKEILDSYIDDKSLILEQKLGFSLIKGWMSSASFMLEAGQNIKDINNRYRSGITAFRMSLGRDGLFIENDHNNFQLFYSIDSNGYSHRLSFQKYNDITKQTKDTMFYKLISGEDRSELYLSDDSRTSTLMRIFFPGIIKLKKLSGGSTLTKVGEDSCIRDFNKCRSAGVNPLKDVIEMGSDMMTTGMIYAISSSAISSVLDYAAKSTGSKTFAFGAELTSLFSILFAIYMILGMAILYLPSILIFAYFLGNTIGWLSNVFIFTLLSVLWVIMHLFPERGKGFAGKASYGYKKLLDILLRPSFIVFGVFVTFIITSVMLSILNILFAITINTFELFNTPNNFIEFIMNYIVYIIYVILVIVVLWRSVKAIYKVPNALMDWFQFENDQNQDIWNQMSSYFTYSVTSVLIKN